VVVADVRAAGVRRHGCNNWRRNPTLECAHQRLFPRDGGCIGCRESGFWVGVEEAVERTRQRWRRRWKR